MAVATYFLAEIDLFIGTSPVRQQVKFPVISTASGAVDSGVTLRRRIEDEVKMRLKDAFVIHVYVYNSSEELLVHEFQCPAEEFVDLRN